MEREISVITDIGRKEWENGMELLKLVIVDDEPILLQGLLQTYDWKSMGFEVAGTAQSGEQAITVIKEVRPHAVLTDIRMKQITGLMVMEEIQKTEQECLFIVLSAYRDFDYAQQACDLGAFAYLLKPIEDEKLYDVMNGAYQECVRRIENKKKYESWEKLIGKDEGGFLKMIIQKYVQTKVSEETVEEVFRMYGKVPGENDWFLTVCIDIDLVYKITKNMDYETPGRIFTEYLEEKRISFVNWKAGENGSDIFLIRIQEKDIIRNIKIFLDSVNEKVGSPVAAVISKPYKRIAGIKKSYLEAQEMMELSEGTSAGTFVFSAGIKESIPESQKHNIDTVLLSAIRNNRGKEFQDIFTEFIYHLPEDEEQRCNILHLMMLKVEFMLQNTYGMTEEIRKKFRNYYYHLKTLNSARTIEVCYQILCEVMEERKKATGKDAMGYLGKYMSEAVAYIDEHLQDESLSVVSVAEHIYLNPVYFGRVFKKAFHMTFKQYLMKQRMEKAKILLESGNKSIGEICDEVGIHNPSYFSHLFKQYTGKIPSDYRKEYDS